jgi:splicing factor U2AF subunit
MKHGEIEDLIVCDNLGDHLIGNVYVKFSEDEQAEEALKGLSGRYYSGRPIVGEYSPVTDFRESRCRQYDEGSCGSKIHNNIINFDRRRLLQFYAFEIY